MKKLIKSLIFGILIAVVITLLSFAGNILAHKYLEDDKTEYKAELMP